jgi:heat shock protein HslJ
MKKVLLLLLLLCSVTAFSQSPNPDLYQTWYLRFVQANDLTPAYTISEITPTVTPTLTILNTLEFSGVGDCNTFTGSFSNVTNDQWGISVFAQTQIICNTPPLGGFEGGYFGFLNTQGGWYQIVPEGNGLVLMMYNPIFGSAIFQNFSLKAAGFEKESIALYPNPSTGIFNLDSKQLQVSKIQVVNSLGQLVKTQLNTFEVIDIADVPVGVYILKIDTDHGAIEKKIIKE